MIYIGLGIIAVLGVATYFAPRVMGVSLWAFITTALLCAALLATLPGPFRDKAMWIALLMPALWVGLQFWSMWEKRHTRVLISFTALSLGSLALLILTEPKV